MSRKDKIQKHLRKHYVKDIDMILDLVVQLTIRNPELNELAECDKHEFFDIVSEETGENIDSKIYEMLQDKSLEVYKTIDTLATVNPHK